MSAWQDFVAGYRVGDVAPGRITMVVPFGALMEVAGVPGLLTGVAVGGLAAGDEIPVRIAAIDDDRQRVALTAP